MMEQQPAGDRRGRVQRNVDIVESRGNGPQPSMRHDDDEEENCRARVCVPITSDR